MIYSITTPKLFKTSWFDEPQMDHFVFDIFSWNAPYHYSSPDCWIKWR